MKILLLTLVTIFPSVSVGNVCGLFDQKWAQCSQDEDCISIKGTCELRGVNRKFQKESASYYGCMSQFARCNSPESKINDSKKIPKCEMGVCKYTSSLPSTSK